MYAAWGEREREREESWRGAADREREKPTGRENKSGMGRRGVRSRWQPAWLKTTVN